MKKKLLKLLTVALVFPLGAIAQNVGVDVAVPEQKLDVAGGLKIGNTGNGVAGSMRWNGTNFQVHNGTQWITFGLGSDLYWTLYGTDIAPSALASGNVGIGTTTPAAKLQVVGTARVSALNVNGAYTLPTADGTNGYVLTTNGAGAVIWSDPALVGDITSVVAGNGLVGGGTSGAVTLDVNPGDGILLNADQVQVRASDLDGDGISVTSNNFNVNVDNSTLEINADALRVRNNGITAAQIATGAVASDEILDGSITSADIAIGGVASIDILDGTITAADMANAGNDQVLVTDATGVPTWQNQTTLFGGQAGDGLVNDVTNSELDVNPGDGIEVVSDQVRVKASDLQGKGITVTANNFDVDVDNATLEVDIVTDKVRVKADGILSSHIAPETIVAADIATGAVTTSEILNATILPADVASPGSPNLVLSTNASNVVGWNDPATLSTTLQDTDTDTKIEVERNADDDHIRMGTAGVDRLTITNTGNIGIGIADPAKMLEVAAPTGGQLLLARNDPSVNLGETLGEILFDAEDTDPSSVDASAVIRGVAAEPTVYGNSDKGGHLTFLTKANATDGNAAATERMRITEAGNVGIGTTSPTFRLDVAGTTRSQGNATIGTGVDRLNLELQGTFHRMAYNELRFWDWNTGGDMVTFNNGNVGIGTTAPSYSLHAPNAVGLGQTRLLNSDIYFTNTAHNHSSIGNTAGHAAIENAADYNTLMIMGRSNGIGGVRSVSVWDRLDVNGSLYVTSLDQDATRLVLADANGMLYPQSSLVGTGLGDNLGNHIATTGIKRNDHATGFLEGSYNNVGPNSAVSNPIYTIGSSYNPSNTALNNMYGIGYSHGNFWGSASNRPTGWGQYVAADGDIRIILDGSNGSIWSSGDVRTQIYYDSNDMGYYLDPNSTSNSALRIRGGALHGPNPSWGAYMLVGGDGRNGYIDNGIVASASTTNGNLHLDAASGKDTYINFYDGNTVRFGRGNNTERAVLDGNGFYLYDGWFRNYGQTGIYNQSYGNHFYGIDPNYWFSRSNHGIIIGNVGGTYRGYLYHDDGDSFGLLDRDGTWAVRTVRDQYVEFRDNNEVMMRVGANGNVGYGTYGSVWTDGGGLNSWEGYNINGRYAFMSADDNSMGLYNDVDNRWVMYHQRNSATYFYQPNGGDNIYLNTNTDLVMNGNSIWNVNTMTVNTIYDYTNDIVHFDQTRVRIDVGSSRDTWFENYGGHPHIRPGSAGWGYIGRFNNYWLDVWTLREYRNQEYGFSDRRVKQNIRPLHGNSSLAKVMSLTGYRYDLDLETHPLLGPDPAEHEWRDNLGFIAQELMEIVPEMVVYDENTGHYMVKNYEQMLPILVEAMKEQQRQIEDLKGTSGQRRVSDFGSVQLTGNTQWVEFSSEFRNELGTGTIPAVQLTTNDFDTKVIVKRKTSEGFEIERSGASSVQVDWHAMAKVSAQPQVVDYNTLVKQDSPGNYPRIIKKIENVPLNDAEPVFQPGDPQYDPSARAEDPNLMPMDRGPEPDQKDAAAKPDVPTEPQPEFPAGRPDNSPNKSVGNELKNNSSSPR